MEIKYIGIFGKRNAGKSSMINTLLGEQVAIVSAEAGTTTDPVRKRMEINGVGAVQLIDTAGLDDEGELGKKRVEKTRNLFSKIDMGIILFTGNDFGKLEIDTLKELNSYSIPVLLVHNQSDIVSLDSVLAEKIYKKHNLKTLDFSCSVIDENEQNYLVERLLQQIKENLKKSDRTILQGMVKEGDEIVLVCPIDNGAPTGRMILPQVMAIRDVLDHKGIATVLEPCNLKSFLKNRTPALIVTDSQAFKEVADIVPERISLTSFSVLLARQKGPFERYIEGAKRLSELKEGDSILILESCSHHASCDDIGRIKLPKMLRSFTEISEGGLRFTFVSGLDEIPNLDYTLAIQCGGCMVTTKQLNNRVEILMKKGVAVTNYGMAIAYMNGIFERLGLK